MIDVDAKYLQLIKNILNKHVPEYEVRSFGSRVTGKAKAYSDLDLVIMSKKIIAKKIIYDLEEEFAESDLPFRIDILDWQAIPDNFRKIIKTKSERLN
jgi:uncharacterized protein